MTQPPKDDSKLPAAESITVLDPTVEISTKGSILLTSFQGPLPPPDILAGYEKLIPGAADRIFQMAERQARSRQENEHNFIEIEKIKALTEQKRVDGDNETTLAAIGEQEKGRKLAFVFITLLTVGLISLAAFNKDIASYGLVVAELGFLVASFLASSKKSHSSENQSKDES